MSASANDLTTDERTLGSSSRLMRRARSFRLGGAFRLARAWIDRCRIAGLHQRWRQRCEEPKEVFGQ